MNIPEQCILLVKHFEGFSSKPYLCPAGVTTIGYGQVLRDGKGKPLTSLDGVGGIEIDELRASAMLREELERYGRAVLRLCPVDLTDGMFGALTSFCYNLGPGNLQASTLRRKVNRGEHDEAVGEFGRWVFAGGRKLSGLVRRRAAEAVMYAS